MRCAKCSDNRAAIVAVLSLERHNDALRRRDQLKGGRSGPEALAQNCRFEGLPAAAASSNGKIVAAQHGEQRILTHSVLAVYAVAHLGPTYVIHDPKAVVYRFRAVQGTVHPGACVATPLGRSVPLFVHARRLPVVLADRTAEPAERGRRLR